MGGANRDCFSSTMKSTPHGVVKKNHLLFLAIKE
jgi:hypothetical protein